MWLRGNISSMVSRAKIDWINYWNSDNSQMWIFMKRAEKTHNNNRLMHDLLTRIYVFCPTRKVKKVKTPENCRKQKKTTSAHVESSGKSTEAVVTQFFLPPFQFKIISKFLPHRKIDCELFKSSGERTQRNNKQRQICFERFGIRCFFLFRSVESGSVFILHFGKMCNTAKWIFLTKILIPSRIQ